MSFDTILLAELDVDPEAIGYDAAGWSGIPPTAAQYQAVADLINAVDRPQTVDATPQALFGAIKPADWPVAQEDRDYLSALASMGTIPLTEPEVQNRLTGGANGIFAAGATATAIEALWAGLVSRATELGIHKVSVGDLIRLKEGP